MQCIIRDKVGKHSDLNAMYGHTFETLMKDNYDELRIRRPIWPAQVMAHFVTQWNKKYLYIASSLVPLYFR